jgi:hypothetical protein
MAGSAAHPRALGVLTPRDSFDATGLLGGAAGSIDTRTLISQLMHAQADPAGRRTAIGGSPGDSYAAALNRQITDWNSRLTDVQTALHAKFAALQTALSRLRSQHSYLTDMLETPDPNRSDGSGAWERVLAAVEADACRVETLLGVGVVGRGAGAAGAVPAEWLLLGPVPELPAPDQMPLPPRGLRAHIASLCCRIAALRDEVAEALRGWPQPPPGPTTRT